jgi:AraC-like DNA-binding protein
MYASQLDVVIRAAAVAALLFLALLLGRDGRGRRPAMLFVPLALGLSGFVIGNTPDAALRLAGPAGDIAHLVSGYGAVFIWWFCLACFDPGFRPRGWVLATGLAWMLIASLDRGLGGRALAGIGLSWVLVGFGFVMVGHLAWRLLGDREGDLLESRRGARLWVVVLLSGLLLVDLLADVVMGLAWRPAWFAMGQNAAILGFTLWLAARLLRADPAPLSFTAAPGARPAPEPAASPLAERLRRLVEVDRIHLDPELSFSDFVRRMGAPERTVRRLINHELGHDHFRTFLNACRMQEARRLLADPARAGDKLIAIALDSGFASLASFNRVFRDLEGCTPSAYRAARLGAPASEEPLAVF